MKGRWVWLMGSMLLLGGFQMAHPQTQGRNDFVFGLGLGVGVLSFDLGTGSKSDPGLAVGLKLGAALSAQVQLYFSGLVSPLGYKYLHITIFGIGGPAIRYFFRDGVSTPFLCAGWDVGIWDRPGFWEFGVGTGFRIGGGYELSRHWRAEGIYSWIDGEEFDISTVWIVLNYEL